MVYFEEVTVSDRKGGLVNNIRLNLQDGAQLVFRADHSSKMADKAMGDIVNGLNHLLFWAQDNGKELFINKFCEYMLFMRTRLMSSDFQKEVEYKLMSGEAEDEASARAEILFKVISNIPDIIIDTIIEYVDKNTFNNIALNFHQESLDEIDVLTLNATMTMSKIVTIGYTVLPKMRIDFYTYEPTMQCIDMISDRLANDYFINVSPSVEKYNIIMTKNLRDSLYTFMYAAINGPDEIDDNIMVDNFKQNGMTKDRMNQDVFKNLMVNIYKNVPIEYMNTSEVVKYKTGDDYKKFMFVNKNTIKYIKTIAHRMINHKFMGKHLHVVNTHTMVSDDGNDDYEASLKQELYMEKKNVSDIKRRRYYIELLKRYSDDYFQKNEIQINKLINRNDLCNHFIIKILSELGEDHLSAKLLDITTYTKLIYLIADKLAPKYPLIALALKADSRVTSNVMNKRDIQERIKSLAIYKRHATNVERNLANIIGYAYRYDEGPNTGALIDIADQFVQYLQDIENKEYNIEFLEGYIYEYESK